jgi:4-amino-4-deoxy-L-arabinose transferase-like glycosyltransferase
MQYDKDDRCHLSGPRGYAAAGLRGEDSEPAARKYVLAVIGFLAGLTAVRLALLASGVLNLSGDEAHYWEWSRRLDWCYYSKPPGVALLVRAGTLLFGNTELGVRFLAPVLSLLSSIVMYHLGQRLYGRRAGLAAAVLLQIMPLVSAFGLGMTPDTPLIFFWLLSLYFLHRAWSTGAVLDWLLLAISLGLGLLSKYAIVFLYVPAWLLLLTTPQGRLRLRTPWPYLSFALSLLFFLPVIVWNSQHGWVMFRHDLGHTNLAHMWSLSGINFLAFVGGQLGVITPIMAVLMLYLLVKRRRQDPFCFWLTIPILAGFLLKSLQGKVQPNWPLTAWLAGLIPLADFLVHHYQPLSVNQKRLVSAGLIIPAVATLFLHLPFLTMNIPWPGRTNPFRKLVGWRQLGAEVTQIAQGMDQPFVLSDYYMTASELAFYVGGRPPVYCVNLGRRMNQYDIWAGFDKLAGRQAVYVVESEMDPNLAAAFERVQPQPPITIRNNSGQPLKTFRAYRCYGFKGWTPKSSGRY